jgi:hypothetical protein
LSTADIEPAVLAAFDGQMTDFYAAARRQPWADIKIDDDAIWGSTGIPLPVFNGAVAATFTEENADDRIERILGYFRDLKLDMSWWVGPTTTPPDLGDRLVAHGMTADDTNPGMAVSLDDWDPPPVPEGIEIEPAVDAASFHEASDLMFEAFQMPRHIQPMYEERFAEFCIGPRAIQRTYLARIGGTPVATSLGMVANGIVGVYNVATPSAWRRRGAGTAVTAAAMTGGRSKGARWAILESSQMGRSVYERLGFREVTKIAIYIGNFSGSPVESHS